MENADRPDFGMVSGGGRIETIVGPGPNEVFWRIAPGNNANCDYIDPYLESCEQGPAAWLRIVKDGKTLARVNALHLDEIRYVQEVAPAVP